MSQFNVGFASYAERLRSELAQGWVAPALRPLAGLERLATRLAARAETGSPGTWALMGPPGAGKSAAAVALMLDLLARGVACARWDASVHRERPGLPMDGRTLAAALGPPEVDAALWRSRAKRGSIVLFVDGVEELAREVPGVDPWKLLLAEQGCPIVVTLNAARKPLPLHVCALRLAPLPAHAIGRFLDARGVDPERGLAALKAAGLEGVAGRPRFLSALARELAAGRELPRTRAGLLDRLGPSSQSPEEGGATSLALHQRFRDQPLPTLAWAADAPVSFIGDWAGSAADVEGRVRWLMGEALRRRRLDVLVDVVLANRGALPPLVRARAWRSAGEALLGDPLVRFRAAQQLVDLPASLLGEALGEGLLAGLMEEDHVGFVAMQADLLRGELAPATLDALMAEPPLESEPGLELHAHEHLLAEALAQLETATGSYRRAAANALGHAGERGAVAGLLHVLQPGVERDAKVRGSATNALGQIGDASAVPALTRVLDPAVESEPRVRASAATALGSIGDSAAAPALLAVLHPAKEPESRVRAAAARALAWAGDAATVSGLCASLAPRFEPDPWVRATVAATLGRLGDADAVPILAGLLAPGREEDAGVRAGAAGALGSLRDRRAEPSLLGCVRIAVEPAALVRGAAAAALGRVGGATALPTLSAMLSTDLEPDAIARAQAITALGEIGEPRAVPAIVLALGSDPDGFVRASAAAVLGRIGARPGLAALQARMDRAVEDDPEVRAAAARALGEAGDRAAVPALCRALSASDEDGGVRRAAAEALGRARDVGAHADLLAVATDEGLDFELRAAAVDALSALSTGAESWMLAIPIRSGPRRGGADDRPLRESVSTALFGNAGHPDVRKRLRTLACADPDGAIRASSIHALAASGGLDDATVEHLLDPAARRRDESRRDPDPAVRVAVCRAVLASRDSSRRAAGLVALLLAESSTGRATVRAVFGPFLASPGAEAAAALARLVPALPTPVPNPHLPRMLEELRKSMLDRAEAERSLDALRMSLGIR